MKILQNKINISFFRHWKDLETRANNEYFDHSWYEPAAAYNSRYLQLNIKSACLTADLYASAVAFTNRKLQ